MSSGVPFAHVSLRDAGHCFLLVTWTSLKPLRIAAMHPDGKHATTKDSPGILDGWIVPALVWAAVIAMLLAVVAALLGSAE